MKPVNKTLAALAAISISLTACGGGSDKATTSTAPVATNEPAGTVSNDVMTGDTMTGDAMSGDTMSGDTMSGDAMSSTAPSGTALQATGDLEALHKQCVDEGGVVNLIALPDEWANYKGILASFGEKYPDVEHPVRTPNATSQEELDAVVNLAGQPEMPDALDVSPAKAQTAIDQGLWAPYTPTVNAEIPDNLKDPAGNWVGAYYGVTSIGTNTTIVKNAPKSFADLAKPEYKGQVALNGDPRTSGSGFAAVMAASLANGGSPDDIMPGIKFFADLKASGNLIPTDVTQATVISGETPIAIDWSYNYPGLKKAIEDAGFTVEVNYPSDSVYGGFYAQGGVADGPHPHCAQLWIEHLLSNEGALGYIEGGAMPARFAALEKAGAIPADVKGNLPPAEILSKVQFLTQAQNDAAQKVLEENWGPMVADK